MACGGIVVIHRLGINIVCCIESVKKIIELVFKESEFDIFLCRVPGGLEFFTLLCGKTVLDRLFHHVEDCCGIGCLVICSCCIVEKLDCKRIGVLSEHGGRDFSIRNHKTEIFTFGCEKLVVQKLAECVLRKLTVVIVVAVVLMKAAEVFFKRRVFLILDFVAIDFCHSGGIAEE